MKKVLVAAVLALLTPALAAHANAQSLYGALVGNVTDETGAALPGATVTVTQAETNLSRDVVTGEAGSYNVPNLLPGTYQVVVKLRNMNLQLRIEALNLTNTPHFANPASNIANLQLNADGTVRNLNGFGVITSTNRLGRQYDEREFRLGIRMTF